MNRRRPRKSPTPQFRFTPTAWAILLWLRDRGETEIGGFGISTADDLLLVEDFVLVTQQTTAVTVAFDDRTVGDFFDEQVDQGRRPEQCGRIWLHTHPGDDPTPSSVDEETFQRVFGRCDWAVMGIVARHGAASSALEHDPSADAAPGPHCYRPAVRCFQSDLDPQLRQRQIQVHHPPGRIQSQQLSVMLRECLNPHSLQQTHIRPEPSHEIPQRTDFVGVWNGLLKQTQTRETGVHR